MKLPLAGRKIASDVDGAEHTGALHDRP